MSYPEPDGPIWPEYLLYFVIAAFIFTSVIMGVIPE